MLEELIKLLTLYQNSLDREYDNDCVALAGKIISQLAVTKNDIQILKSMIPSDVPAEIVEKLKNL